ncbi:MAG: hypothetical protein R3297_08520, partial [Desulfobulbales bacterium]|nr:hypothetical protein [Desulfobulbales bacterium]
MTDQHNFLTCKNQPVIITEIADFNKLRIEDYENIFGGTILFQQIFISIPAILFRAASPLRSQKGQPASP